MLNIVKGKQVRPVKLVITGSEGIGKTTLASKAPKVLFIDTEGGSSQLDVARISGVKTWSELISIPQQILKEPDCCKTLVLDTADWAETLCIKAICEKYRVNGLESFGYGKGYTYLYEEFSALLSELNKLIDAGINVIIIAHGIAFSAGDYELAGIVEVLDPYLDRIADELVTYAKNRKTVVFLPLITTSRKFCRLLCERGFKAAEVNGNSSNREQILKDFEDGEIEILCNSMLLTEGWDCPSIDCVVILRPTKIRSLYQQMVGRGMRLSEGKKNLLLLDFLWLSERQNLCRPSSLLSPNSDVSSRVDKMIQAQGCVDLMFAEQVAEHDVVAEREASLLRVLKSMRNREKKLVDPLQFAVSLDDEALMNYEPSFVWEMEPATEKQLQFLNNFGISSENIMNKGHASMIINRIKDRVDMGLSTAKQINLLEKYGFEKVGTWKLSDATSMISRIASNNWKIPRGIIATSYIPGGRV